MPIPQQIIDTIQEKSDIVEVISRYLTLKKSGRSFKACCPFHGEKTPSFIVSPDKQIYHCFGCSAGGNVFSFIMKHESVEFPEAVEMLAEKAGVVMPRGSQSPEMSTLAGKLYKINDIAGEYFRISLESNAAAKDYLASRGIGPETANQFKIGYAPDGWDGLLAFFKKKGIGSDLLEKAGLVISNEKGGHYDRFRRRVIFPIVDLRERTLGFGGRVLDSSLPKYINSPETVIYSKGKNLYGLNLSKEHIRKEGHVLIVEGYLDFVIPFQSGVKNLIATLGTALTAEQIKLLKRFTGTVVMVYDPDEAGEAASLRNMDLFVSEGVNVYIAELPAGLDPDTVIRKLGTEEFLKIVKSAKNLFDYKIDKVSVKHNPRSAHGKAAIAGEMLPTLARIENAVLRSSLIKKLAERLAVDEDALKEELKKVRPDHGQRSYAIRPVEVKRDYKKAEEMVLALMLEGEPFIGRVREQLTPEEFRDSAIRDAVRAIFELASENVKMNPAKVITQLGNSESANAVISDAVGLLEKIIDRDRALAECIVRIRKDCKDGLLGTLKTQIDEAYHAHDEHRWKTLMVEFDRLRKSA